MALRTTPRRTPTRLCVSARARCIGPARPPLSGGFDFDKEEALSTRTACSLFVPRCLAQARDPRGGVPLHLDDCPACRSQPLGMHRLPASTPLLMPQPWLARSGLALPGTCGSGYPGAWPCGRKAGTTSAPFTISEALGSCISSLHTAGACIACISTRRRTVALRGRRRAKRGGYPTAGPLLGAPLERMVRRLPAKNHGFEPSLAPPSLHTCACACGAQIDRSLWLTSIRRARLPCTASCGAAYHTLLTGL